LSIEEEIGKIPIKVSIAANGKLRIIQAAVERFQIRWVEALIFITC